MRRFISSLTLVLAGIVFFSAHNAFAQKKMKKEPVMWAAENIKWEQMKDAPSGVMSATLWGDMTKGGYGAFVKFPADIKHPLHTHSSDIKTVILSGTFTYAPEGSEVKSYGTGSYILIPGGSKHITGSGADGCTFFMEQPGKFDMVPVEMKKDEMMKK